MKLSYCASASRYVLLGGILLSLFGAGTAYANQLNDQQAVVTLDQQTITLTTQLLTAMQRLEATPSNARTASIANLARLVEQRELSLLNLLKRDPKLAASRMLPSNLSTRVSKLLPAEAQAHVEKAVQLKGTVSAVAMGHSVQDHQYLFFFQPSTAPTESTAPTGGEKMRLYMPDADSPQSQLAWLKLSNKNVTLQATRLGTHLLVKDIGQVTVNEASVNKMLMAQSSVANLVQDDRKLLVILVNFDDGVANSDTFEHGPAYPAGALACKKEEVYNRVFGKTGVTVNHAFNESSYGRVSFSGDVVGPYTIHYSVNGGCDSDAWAKAANEIAKNNGFDPAQYQHISYSLPYVRSCGAGAYGEAPGKLTWVQSCNEYLGGYAHELAHNIGMNHAFSALGIPSDDLMNGTAPTWGFNGPHRVQAGWVPSGSVRDLSSGGTYELSALELTNSSTPKYFASRAMPMATSTSRCAKP